AAAGVGALVAAAATAGVATATDHARRGSVDAAAGRAQDAAVTRYVDTQAGHPLRVARAGTSPRRTAETFVHQNARGLGVDPAELREAGVRDLPGRQHVVRYQQRRGKLPVLGGEAAVTVDDAGGVLSAHAAAARPANGGPAGT